MAKYEEWITEEGLLKIRGYARDGLVGREMAEAMGVSRTTLNKWCKKYPKINDAMKEGKEVADRKVEASLFNNCIDKTVKLRKPIKVRQVTYDPGTGKRIKETEKIVMADTEEYIRADTKAQIFWLINRKPDVWKQRVEVGSHEDGIESGTIQIESRGSEDIIDGRFKEIIETTETKNEQNHC